MISCNGYKVHLFHVNMAYMQLHVKYSRVTNQLCTIIHLKQFKRFSDEKCTLKITLL